MPRKQWVDFAKVRERLRFEDVLSHYGIAYPEGRIQLKLHCPFHDDSTPSCSIILEKKNFKCFGCSAKGNVLDFIILKEKGDVTRNEDRHAAAVLAVELMGEDIKQFGKGSSPARSASAAKPKPKGDAKAKPTPTENPVFDRVLQLDHEHPFLTTRNVTPELAEKFGLGFCAKGIMRNRIAIPIHRPTGECVGYVGRWADDELPEDTEKYSFPKGFSKSLELWNIHRALTLESRFLVLVEGYWSTIRLHELGIATAALMGTSISEQQANLIRDLGYKFAILLLDGDDAGRQAIPEAANILSQHVYVRTVSLPDGEKPDSVPESFLQQFL